MNTNASTDKDSSAAREVLDRFLAAFETLDWDSFRQSFADDVSIFFPFPDRPRLVLGRKDTEAVFRNLFDHLRSTTPGPRHLDLTPTASTWRIVGGMALATLELRGQGGLSRRSIVLEDRDGAWRITHMHASEM